MFSEKLDYKVNIICAILDLASKGNPSASELENLKEIILEVSKKDNNKMFKTVVSCLEVLIGNFSKRKLNQIPFFTLFEVFGNKIRNRSFTDKDAILFANVIKSNMHTFFIRNNMIYCYDECTSYSLDLFALSADVREIFINKLSKSKINKMRIINFDPDESSLFLIKAIKEVEVKEVKRLLKEGTSRVNSVGIGNQTILDVSYKIVCDRIKHRQNYTDALEIFYQLIECQQFVSIDELNDLVDGFIFNYSKMDSEEDISELFKTLENLIGKILNQANESRDLIKLAGDERKKYLAAIQSMKPGEDSKFKKGMLPLHVLILQSYAHLYLLAKSSAGVIQISKDKNGNDIEKHEIVSVLKHELQLILTAVELNKANYYIRYIDDAIKNNRGCSFFSLFGSPAVMETAFRHQARGFIKKLKTLEEGTECFYPVGWKGHTIYIAFVKYQGNLIIRLDNLGDGAELHQSQLDDKVASKAIGQFSFNQQTEQALEDYLTLIFKGTEEEKILMQPYLYDLQGQLPLEPVSQDYIQFLTDVSSKKLQSVGNCTVKGYFAGFQVRLAQAKVWQERQIATKDIFDELLSAQRAIVSNIKIKKKIENVSRIYRSPMKMRTC